MCEVGMLTHPTAAHLAECETCRRAIVAVVEQLRERLAISEAARVAAVDNAVQATIDRLTAEHEADRVRLVARYEGRIREMEETIASQGATIKLLSPPATRGQS